MPALDQQLEPDGHAVENESRSTARRPSVEQCPRPIFRARRKRWTDLGRPPARPRRRTTSSSRACGGSSTRWTRSGNRELGKRSASSRPYGGRSRTRSGVTGPAQEIEGIATTSETGRICVTSRVAPASGRHRGRVLGDRGASASCGGRRQAPHPGASEQRVAERRRDARPGDGPAPSCRRRSTPRRRGRRPRDRGGSVVDDFPSRSSRRRRRRRARQASQDAGSSRTSSRSASGRSAARRAPGDRAALATSSRRARASGRWPGGLAPTRELGLQRRSSSLGPRVHPARYKFRLWTHVSFPRSARSSSTRASRRRPSSSG